MTPKGKKPTCKSKTAVGSTPLGERLKRERLRRGYTLHEFAEKVGVCHSQITGMENRGVVLRMHNMIAVAQALDCSLDWLLGLDEWLHVPYGRTEDGRTTYVRISNT